MFLHAKDANSVKIARYGSAGGKVSYNQAVGVELKCYDILELNQKLRGQVSQIFFVFVYFKTKVSEFHIRATRNRIPGKLAGKAC